MVGILICVAIAYKGFSDPTQRETRRACKVLGKMHEAAGYKVSARWLLILETGGKRFSLKVAPDTYWVAKEGETLYFDLSDSDIDRSVGSVWFAIMAILGSSGTIIGLVVLLVCWESLRD